MKNTTIKSVNMTYRALYNYVLNTNYRSFSGVTGLLLSVMGLVILIAFWDKLAQNQRFVFLMVGIAFTVVNPLMLAFRTFRQFKLSPSYKQPLVYTFGDEGILVEQGDASQKIEWNKICKVMMTTQILAIYTNRLHAFVLPLEVLGDERGKIITTVVQFTAPYKPALSSNLKRFISGKGI